MQNDLIKALETYGKSVDLTAPKKDFQASFVINQENGKSIPINLSIMLDGDTLNGVTRNNNKFKKATIEDIKEESMSQIGSIELNDSLSRYKSVSQRA